MSSQVKELVAAGLVTVSVEKDDRRSKRVTATKRGIAILEDGRGKRIDELAKMRAEFSAEELETLSRAAILMERLLADE